MSAVEWAIQSADAAKFVDAAKGPIMASGLTAADDNVEKKCLENLKALLQNSLTIVNSQLAAMSKQDVVAMAKSSGELLLEIDNIQCFEPRGRFNLKITSTSLFLEGKQFSVLVPVDAVSDVVCLPSFTSAKKEGEDYLAFQLNAPVKVNNKDVKSLLINLVRTTNPSTRSKSGDNDLSESSVVMMAVQDATGVHISRPQASLFATVREQKPYLKCYRGTQEGAIYPLQSGVIFVKPLLFIPADEIASITAGRGGGAGNTRYVDLMIETADEKMHEFTNIDRDELPALQMYVKGYLEARALKQQKAQPRSKPKSVKSEPVTVEMTSDVVNLCEAASPSAADAHVEVDGNDLDDSDSDEDDDDYDPYASDSEDGDGRGRKKRARGSDADEGSGSDGNGSDSDSDSDASSDDDSDNSDGSSDAGSNDDNSVASDGSGVRRGTDCPTKKFKTTCATAASKAKVPTAKAPKHSEPAKKVNTEIGSSAGAKVVRKPGEKIERIVPPGAKLSASASATVKLETAVVNLTQEEIAVKPPAPAGKEGRKSAPLQKKAPPVKREPGAPKARPVPEVVVLERSAEVPAPKGKSEPMVVNMCADTVVAKKEAVSTSTPPPAAAKAVSASTAPVAVPAVGVKRTIMDMFATQKKPAVAPSTSAASTETAAAVEVMDLSA